MKQKLCGGILLAFSFLAAGCGPEGHPARFLATWSPDGSRAALVSDLLDEDEDESGIWILDADTGRIRQIVQFQDGRFCLHPRWSPYRDELAFLVVEREFDDEEDGDENIPFSVWTVNSDGSGLRQRTTSRIPKDALLSPSLLSWGPAPETLIFQQAEAGKSMAMLLDVPSGGVRPLLPLAGDSCSLALSPSGERLAVLVRHRQEGISELYLAEPSRGTWRQVEKFPYTHDAGEELLLMIYWSPDSTRFVVSPFSTEPTDGPRFSSGIVDAATGHVRLIPGTAPESEVLWRPDGGVFAFSARVQGSSRSDVHVFTVDAATGHTVPIVTEGDNHLLSWSKLDGRIYFYNVYKKRASEGNDLPPLQKFFSTAPDGTDTLELPPALLTSNSGWSLSPDGTRAVFFSSSLPPGFLDLIGNRSSVLAFTSRQEIQLIDHWLALNEIDARQAH